MRFGRNGHWLAIVFCGLAGCWTTRPFIDIRDHFKPGHMYANKVEPYGGVCRPQGAPIVPAGGGFLPGPSVPPPVPVPSGGAPFVPGPSAPFPSTPAPPSPGGNTTPPVFPR